MKNITNCIEVIRSTNGGKTYHCPFGCNKSGGYWTVYGHCLAARCYLRNAYFRTLNDLAGACLNLAGILSGFIK